MRRAWIIAAAALLLGCQEPEPAPAPSPPPARTPRAEEGKIVKSEDEWKAQLTDLEYHVTREKGTERPFTGRFWNTKTEGTYYCVCCGAELFTSDTKYDSGCGWPSFYEAAKGGAIEYTEDRSLGMVRTEITCARCDAHLGHVFDDGPEPTGRRYCVNSASLEFVEKTGKE